MDPIDFFLFPLIEISSWFDVLWGIGAPIAAGRDHEKMSVTTGRCWRP